MRYTFLIPSTFILVMISACATNSGANYEPIVDGAKTASYATDLSQCQTLAEERSYLNDDTQQNMMIGAALGAVVGLADGDVSDTEGAIGGAVAGAIGGTIEGSVEARGERKQIVVECMAGRGHQVVG